MTAATDNIESQAMDLLDKAMKMKLGLSEDESVYDLTFISAKLAQVSVYQERLSDIQMALTQLSIGTIKTHRAVSAALRVKEKQLKATDDYAQLPLNEKGNWLETELATMKEQAGTWSQLTAVLAEIKAAVADRLGTMKRLDSDLRLHSRIYEQRVAAGATSPSSYKGNNTKNIDL